jgi:hypothetical protein
VERRGFGAENRRMIPLYRTANPPPARSEVLFVGGKLFALALAAFVCTHAWPDPDLWGHLRFGLDTLAGHLPRIDPYSLTQDRPWINHEWLSEAAMALAYRAGGTTGLLLLKTAVIGLALLVIGSVTRRAPRTVRWWLLGLAAVAITPGSFTIRPQIWTVLAVPILWQMLNGPRPALIAVLFALWANLHGGWIVGVGIGFLWLTGRTIDRRTPDWPRAAMLSAGVVATLLNPYGWGLWRFLLSTVRVSRNITEWRPVWQQSEPTALILWSLVALVLLVTLGRRRLTLTWSATLPILGLSVMSAMVSRLLPIFGEIAVLGLAQTWRRDSTSDAAPANIRSSHGATVLAVDLALVAVIALANLIPQSRCFRVDQSWTPDRAAAGALEAAGVRGRLVVPFEWGEYAIWHLGPGLRVSVDGRRETVYSEPVVAEQLSVAHGTDEGLRWLSRERPEYVWLALPAAERTAAWAAQHGYRIDLRTDRSFIATRADLPVIRAGLPTPACFP